MVEHEPVSNIGRERLGPHLINFRALNAKKHGRVRWRKEIVPDRWTGFPLGGGQVESAHAGRGHRRGVGLEALDMHRLHQEGQVEPGEGVLGLKGFRRAPERIKQGGVRGIGLHCAQHHFGEEHRDGRAWNLHQGALLGQRSVRPVEPVKVALQGAQAQQMKQGQRGVEVFGPPGALGPLPDQAPDDAVLPGEDLEDGHPVLVAGGAEGNRRLDVSSFAAQSSFSSGSNRLPIRSPKVTSVPTTDWPISL